MTPTPIKKVGEEVRLAGYARLTLKSDQESSMEGVLNTVEQVRGEDIAVEASAAYDKQSKGEVEQVAQEVQAQVRTMRLALESRLGRQIHPTGNYSLGW